MAASSVACSRTCISCSCGRQVDGDEEATDIRAAAAEAVQNMQALKFCRRILAVRPGADLSFVGLKHLADDPVKCFVNHGFCVIDGFVSPKLSSDAYRAVSTSFAAWRNEQNVASDVGAGAGNAASVAAGDSAEGRLDLGWSTPHPRSARSDFVVGLSAEEPAVRNNGPLRAVMEAFDGLLDDLNTLAVLRGQREMQVACYPRGTRGYSRHTDAKPDDGRREERRITAILYLGPQWQSGDGGELRLWPPTAVNAPTAKTEGAKALHLDLEPLPGRLVFFLSGCVPHKVKPVTGSGPGNGIVGTDAADASAVMAASKGGYSQGGARGVCDGDGTANSLAIGSGSGSGTDRATAHSSDDAAVQSGGGLVAATAVPAGHSADGGVRGVGFDTCGHVDGQPRIAVTMWVR